MRRMEAGGGGEEVRARGVSCNYIHLSKRSLGEHYFYFSLLVALHHFKEMANKSDDRKGSAAMRLLTAFAHFASLRFYAKSCRNADRTPSPLAWAF